MCSILCLETFPQPPDVDNGNVLYSEEDCLSFNIYSPIAAGGCLVDAVPKLPVMFYSK